MLLRLSILLTSVCAFHVPHFNLFQQRVVTQERSGRGRFSWTPQSQSPSLVQTSATISPPSEVAVTDNLSKYVEEHGGSLPIRKVLIANNGMAATKSILSMRQWAYMELGDEKAIEFVAMATPEDLKANAEFIKLADSFVEVPAGKNSNNYASVDVIVKIAVDKGVDAVWPGWGHASENPLLPETLLANGIKFIGPTSSVMSVLGDKIAANILAQTAKVPSIPWSGDGLEAVLTDDGRIPEETFNKAMVTTVEEALAAANRIGYPVMLKASEGGGGKGIRMSNNDEELTTGFSQVKNEVPGSPMFMMQLCQGARHLEVQIVGDEHGNAVALNGRDCSTQRRFQKIFEEGPPIIAPPETFKEMERAAQRLTQSIGYIGAGTVEYLFNAETGAFYFLELNPRLQVEHPVTEGISQVNLPATQLQVAMGIPLNRIPEIRRFYDLDMEGDSKIDFLKEDYRKIDTHVIAARITAENPDEGFKPTSGTIERVSFQSTTNVWGYFSVGANGGIHEFADSQFGHLFSRGATREAARKSLVLALKEVEVRGDIRTTVDYLVQLLETDDFKDNSIDTAWLDGIIREKSVSTELDPHTTVACAAIYRAFSRVQTELTEIRDSLSMGQLSMSRVKSLNAFPVEILYKDVKYNFDVLRVSPDTYRFTINGAFFEAKVREQPDGALLASFGGSNRKLVGIVDPLGLRIVVDGTTCFLPTIFDPSELRTDVTGKVVQFLQADGDSVNAGEPYVEVEAMKMIMPLKATETGVVKHECSAGSIITSGDLLASLTLKDASKVKRIETFDGIFDLAATPTSESNTMEALFRFMEGYELNAENVFESILKAAPDASSAMDTIASLFEVFLDVELIFAGRVADEVNLELIKSNKDELDKVIMLNMAHSRVKNRVEFIRYVLRQFDDAIVSRFGERPMGERVTNALASLSSLEGREYSALSLQATTITSDDAVEPFETRLASLKADLENNKSDLKQLAKSTSLSAGVDLLSALFMDKDVGAAALETYVRRVYSSHTITDIKVEDNDGQPLVTWGFNLRETGEQKSTIVRQGVLGVVQSSAQSQAMLPTMISKIATVEDTADPINVLHLAYSTGEALPPGSDAEVTAIQTAEEIISAKAEDLQKIGIRVVNLLVAQDQKLPRYFSFESCSGFKEAPLRRDMRPTLYHLLELNRLVENYDITRMTTTARNSQLYLGVESKKVAKGPQPQAVFLRSISHSKYMGTEKGSEAALLLALDELDRAVLDGRVTVTTSSRIFCNVIPSMEANVEEAKQIFQNALSTLQSKYANRLLKLRVDEIEMKTRMVDKDGIVTPLRLIASSMNGKWLEVSSYREYPNAITGVTEMFCPISNTGADNEMCYLNPYPSAGSLEIKRSSVRRISSTYAYDFLGLMEVDLVVRWSKFLEDKDETMPSQLFESSELILDEESGKFGTDIEILGSVRQTGTNDVGMVAWHCTLKTPEHPDGREMVLIANDVTIQSGSFGVREDDFFLKASQYARDRGLPRIYIACNSGARIGLAEKLKPLFKVAWKDPMNPSIGFDYLYLNDEDYSGLPAGTVGTLDSVTVNGELRHPLKFITGLVHGIGVENLRGSGTIAGETARAYDETFTLSYVTGRTVGIGAYLVRLGQRTIQMEVGPMILTGFSALNKLLGREVYTSQDQLGGPQIMHPNGVSHELVKDDQEGVKSILDWISFIPKREGAEASILPVSDPVDRAVEFIPTKGAYDPRHMLAGVTSSDGVTWTSGFFDKGSFKEYLSGWGKSVVVGRARLGGIPMGVIAVETRLMEQRIPADPANPDSREAVQPQAGQVWYPDSAYKTAQAINDFGRGENLPLIIFANWRGFSGGTRDMAGEILKFGSMIVDALVKYEHPVFVYIPPNAELRGGAWVVIDPTINEEVMEMYADEESRGGILEPPGICEVKFRERDQLNKMHQLDPILASLDEESDAIGNEDDLGSIKAQIKERETQLLPLYLQVAHEFADLHDRAGRMKAKGVVRDVLSWQSSRGYLFRRLRRRLAEDYLRKDIMKSTQMSHPEATEEIKRMTGAAYDDDDAMYAFMETEKADLLSQIDALKTGSVSKAINSLLDGLSEEERAGVLASLQ